MAATDEQQWMDAEGETLEVRTFKDGTVVLETKDVVDLSRRQVLALYETLGAHLAATALDADEDTCGNPLCCVQPDATRAEPCDTEPPTILEEANALVYGDRQGDYGHPREDFTRTAILWTGVLHHKLADGEHITPEDIALCMVQVKVSREVNKPKRDNRVDGAGYFLCLDRLETGR
jgi:hypothetical protein